MRTKQWKKGIGFLVTVVLLCLGLMAAASAAEMEFPERVTHPRLVEAGNDVTVSFPAGRNIAKYKLIVKDTNGWSVVKTATSTQTTGTVAFTIESSNLTANHIYTVEVAAYDGTGSTAKGEVFSSRILNVVSTDDISGDIGFFYNVRNPQVGASHYLTAYAPGASQIWLDMDGDTFQGWSPDNVSLYNEFQEAGTHRIYATAMYEDGTQSTSSITITVGAATGSLYSANVTPVTYSVGGATGSLEQLPETVTSGTAISYTIRKVSASIDASENVWYDSWLRDMTDEEDIALPCFKKQQDAELPEVTLLGNSKTVTIDAADLKAGHTYELTVQVKSAGYKAYFVRQHFTVVPASVSGNLTLSFDGNIASGNDMEIYTDFGLTLEASGETKPTLVRLWLNDYFEYMPWDGDENSIHFGHKSWWTGEHTYFFQAYYGHEHEGDNAKAWDSVSWDSANVSNVLKLNITQNTSAAKIAPTCQETMKKTYTRGEYITLTLANAASMPGTYIGADLYQNGSDNSGHFDTYDGQTITVSTAQLEPGYYALLLYSETRGAGYASTIHHFRVDAPQTEPANGFYFTTSKTQVQSYEDFAVTFSAPDREGCEKTYRFFDGQNYWEDEWLGEDFVNLNVELDPGTWELRAEVLYWPENGDERTVVSAEPVTVTAASRGDAGITVNARRFFRQEEATGGEGFEPYSFTISYPNGIQKLTEREYWSVELWGTDYRMDAQSGDIGSGREIPAECFAPYDTYTLHVHINVLGYDPFDAEIPVIVTGAEQGEQHSIGVTVNGKGDAELSIPSSSDLNVRVNYDSRPTAVRILNHNNWEFWWGWDENESFERRWSFGDGEILIYAEATWDPVDPEEMDRNNWQIQDQGEWRDFDWNRDVSWTAVSNVITLRVSSPHGEMAVPTFTLAKNSLTWGENLTVNVTDTVPKDASGNVVSEGWFYGNLYQIMYDENGEEHWESANRGNDIRIYSGSNLIPTYALDENGGKFAVEIGADAEGYSGRSARLEFTLGKKPQSVSGKFTANGKTGTVNVPTGKEIILSAYHPQAEWYDVEITKEGDERWYENRSDGDGMLYDTWCANEAGKYTLTAYAYANDAFDEDRAEIGTIQINATAVNGPLDPLDAGMTDLAQVGDLIEITFNAPANAEEYSYWVHRPDDGQWLAGASRRGTGTLTLNTALLDSGVYCVDLEARAAGYETSHSRLHFALLDENDTNLSKNDENEEPVYYFTISERQLKTQEGTHIVAYVPGADYVELLVQKMGENGQPSGSLEPYEHRSGPGLDTWYGSGEAGTYSIWLKYGDNMPEQVTTLTITAEGNLTHPVISVNGQPSGTTVPANSGDSLHTLNISIPKVANAESYFIRLSRMDWDGWLYEKGFLTSEFGENTIELPIEHEGIEPGRMLRIECFAHARNYNSASSSWTFLLQESQTSSFTLQVEQKDSYWTAEEVHVTASCPGATAIRVFMNNENRWYRGEELPEDERFTIWDQDTLFYAYATTDPIPEDDNFDLDELNWSMASNVVPIYAETNGPTLVPTLTFNSHVKKGEWFEFEIEGDGDARQMDIRIRDEDGNIMEFRRLWEIGTYQLPTANLTVGERYWVSLSCVQDRHLWNEGPSQILRVDPPEQDQKFFEMNKTEVYRYEPFIPTVYAPGAERVKITLGGGEWGSWDGDSGTNDADWEWFLEDTGTHTFHAYALYNEADGWTEIGTRVMTVKESVPLDLADIQVENVIDVTEECQIRIPLVSGGANYIVEVHYQGQENDWIRMEKWPQEANANHELVFTIEANTLIPDRAYWIDCNIGEEDRDYGHCASYTSKGVMTVDGSNLDRNITLSVNKISAPVNTPVEITVSMASSYDQIPSAVAVYMGDQVRYMFFDDSGVTVEMGDYQPLPETIFARAYYGHDLPEDWDDVDWDSLAWGHATAYVQVTFTSSGNAEPATIGQYNGAVMVGSNEEIVVHITLGNHANEAHANLDRNLHGGDEELEFDDWISWDPEEGTITIPTEGLEPGGYRLYVDNSGEGYENSRAFGFVCIVPDPDTAEPRLVLPGALTEIEEEAFAGTGAYVVVIPDTVRTIGRRAFADSSVELVILPNGVDSIAGDAFDGTNLWVVYGENRARQLAEDCGVTWWPLN